MNTRELDELSRSWSDEELTPALSDFIPELGRLPASGELKKHLSNATRSRCAPDAAPDTTQVALGVRRTAGTPIGWPRCPTSPPRDTPRFTVALEHSRN